MKTITVIRTLDGPLIAGMDASAPPGEYVDRATVDALVEVATEMVRILEWDWPGIASRLAAALAPFAPPEAA